MLKTRKDKSGLGFRDLISYNRAMLGKQAWQISQSPNSLWCQVLKGIYFPESSFWQAEKEYGPSWGWQSLLMEMEVISCLVQWKLGAG